MPIASARWQRKEKLEQLQDRVVNRECEMAEREEASWKQLQQTMKEKQKWYEHVELVIKANIDCHSEIVDITSPKECSVKGGCSGRDFPIKQGR